MNVNGYETMTTFWQDFSIADKFGIHAIKETYTRAFNEWKHDYKYLTELVLVLNWKCWAFYDKGMNEYSLLYSNLYHEANNYAWEHLKGEELNYYYNVTD
jgi:hypothetical protein